MSEDSELKPPVKPTIDGVSPKDAAASVDQQPKTDPKFPSHIEPTPRHQAESHYTKPDPTPLWKIVLEVAALFVLAAYTFAAFKQLHTMNEQLGQMKVASEQAKIDNAASITAQKDIAQQGLAATIDNFRLDQRAWVAEDTISGFPEVDKPFGIQVVIKNTGKTFAKHITDVGIADPVPLGSPANFWKESKVKRTGTILIPPNGTKIITLYPVRGSATAKLSQSGLDEFKSKTLYVFGRIDYADIFGCRHWTTFCYFLDPRENLQLYSACKEHNDADDNRCPDKQ